MKLKLLLTAIVLLAATAMAIRHLSPNVASPASSAAVSSGRKVAYYQSAMHPWIKSDRPGKCPICGMNLVPVYADEDTNAPSGGIRLQPGSVTVLDVQSTAVTEQTVTRTLRVAGTLAATPTNAVFEFQVYERDLHWLKSGQAITIHVPALPELNLTARLQIPAGPLTFDPATGGLTLRANLAGNLNQPLNLPANSWLAGLYAEGAIRSESPGVLAVPRTAILSPGGRPMVYIDAAGGHYEPRAVTLGRVGDDLAEVVSGLKVGEKVVTAGNLLIDAETQISRGDSR